jgi:hypothetical protein
MEWEQNSERQHQERAGNANLDFRESKINVRIDSLEPTLDALLPDTSAIGIRLDLSRVDDAIYGRLELLGGAFDVFDIVQALQSNLIRHFGWSF